MQNEDHALLEAVKHAWNAGYTTGQDYRDDPPTASIGKHNRQYGWEIYACSLTDRNLAALSATPTPAPIDNEALVETKGYADELREIAGMLAQLSDGPLRWKQYRLVAIADYLAARAVLAGSAQ